MKLVCAAAACLLAGCATTPADPSTGKRDMSIKRPAGYGYAFKIGFTWKPPGFTVAIVPVMRPEEVAVSMIQK